MGRHPKPFTENGEGNERSPKFFGDIRMSGWLTKTIWQRTFSAAQAIDNA
jgi:hypothetical protein